MSNELNLTKDEITNNNLEISTDNNQEPSTDNKIVPIANKVDSESVIADTTVTVDTPAGNNTVIADVDTTVTESAVNNTADPINASAATAAPVSELSENDIPKENSQPIHKYHKTESESHYYREEPEEEFHFADEERPRRPLFSFRSANEEESRDRLILSRIKDEDLMEYLALEQRRLEFLQQAKEVKQKRILTAFQLLISLAAIVAITYLLKDNPTILISILYIVGIVAALNIWKNPQDKGKGKWRK